MKSVAALCDDAILRAFNIFKTNWTTHKWKLVNTFKSEFQNQILEKNMTKDFFG